MRYVEIINNKPTRSTGFLKIANNYQNKIITVYDDYTCTNNKYVYDEKTNSIILNSNYQAEQAQKEAERIAMLNLTAADVERALYKAKGVDFDDIITMVQAQPLSEEGEPLIDIKALKIELKANNFYRGSEWVTTVGAMLGFTPKQLDEFFETNDYTKLLTPDEPADTDSDSDMDADTDLDSDTDSEESEV